MIYIETEESDFLSDSVFLGDSITESLSFYKFVDRSRVVAAKGLTASKAMSRVDEVAAVNPRKVFILFGMNDVLSLDKSEKFVDHYVRLIDEIQKKLPEAQIYVQSILPVDPRVQQEKKLLSNARIDEFNEALKKMTENEGVRYLEINKIAENYTENLLEKDGIHYIYKFYDLWLDYIEKNI